MSHLVFDPNSASGSRLSYELPTATRCTICFGVTNPDGSCPDVGSHVAVAPVPSNYNEPARSKDVGAFDRIGLKILSDVELADAINTTPNTLMTWRASGKGPSYVKLGKRVFYRVAAVTRWIESCEKHEGGV